jgi:hypothetical protein
VISSTFENRGYRTADFIDDHAYQIVGRETIDDGFVSVTTNLTSSGGVSWINITVENRNVIEHSAEIVIGVDLAIENGTRPFGHYEAGDSISFSSHHIRVQWFSRLGPISLSTVDDPGKMAANSCSGRTRH